MGSGLRGGAVRRGLVAAALCMTTMGFAAGAAQAGPLYVALGDSYTAGPLTGPPAGTPYSCVKSLFNYPNDIARQLGYTLRDVSCIGASTHHVFDPHGLTFGETNPPQLDGVTSDAKLVTIGLGGNDAGLVGVAVQCGTVGITDPFGHACRTFYAQPGADPVQLKIDNTAPKMAAVIQAVKAKAPSATVAVVGYPSVVPHDGRSCYPLVPMSADDLRFVDELMIAINAMLKSTAQANGAVYVDTYTPTLGHDVCALPPFKFIEALIPTSLGTPLHPNIQGESAMATAVINTLNAPSVQGPIRTTIRNTLGLLGLK